MSQLTDLEQFVALSQILTGESKLDEALADQYLKRLNSQYPNEMQALLNTFGQIANDQYRIFEVKRKIIDAKALLPMAQQIIRIWYTGEFVRPDGKPDTATQEQYYGGSLWKVIQAHAPTNTTELSTVFKQQLYGYWQKPPESNE